MNRNFNLVTILLLLALLVTGFLAFHFSQKSGRFYRENDELLARMDSFEIANSKARTTLAEFRAKNEELESTLETTRQQHANKVRSLEDQVGKKEKQLSELRARMAAQPTDLEIRRQFEQLQSDLEAAEQQLDDQQRITDSLSNEIIALHALNTRLTAKMGEVYIHTREISRGLGRLDARIDQYAAGQAPATDVEQETQATARAVEGRIDEARASLSEFAQQPWGAQMLQEFEALRRELTEKKQALHRLSEEYNAVFLCAGTTDELVRRGILSKQGNRQYVFHPENVNAEGCQRFSRRDRELSFPVRGDIVQFYPPVDNGCYQQIQSGSPSEKRLQLIDANRFWQNKIMVVRTN